MSAYYTREVLPLPAGEVMEPGSIALLPDAAGCWWARGGASYGSVRVPMGMILQGYLGKIFRRYARTAGDVLERGGLALHRP